MRDLNCVFLKKKISIAIFITSSLYYFAFQYVKINVNSYTADIKISRFFLSKDLYLCSNGNMEK